MKKRKQRQGSAARTLGRLVIFIVMLLLLTLCVLGGYRFGYYFAQL